MAVARGAVAASGAGEGMASGSSTDSALVPHLKYQLPSEPHMYVDLVDDEDVVLMFDEVQPNPNLGVLTHVLPLPPRKCMLLEACGASCTVRG